MENLLNDSPAFFSTEIIKYYGIKFIIVVLGLFFSLIIIKKIVGFIKKNLLHKVDKTVLSFTIPIINILLKFILLLTIASYLGVETASFVALLATIGFAIGMALSGVLQDFAGGIIILVLRPFKIDHAIKTQDYIGVVKEIKMFSTVITTPDNQKVVIPNRSISSNALINYSAEENRRVDITFGIGYDDDLKKAKNIILDIATKHNKILKNPAPFVRLGELGDNSVNIFSRVWVKNEDYWDVYFDLMEDIKSTFDKENISIPYPQRTIHIQEKSNSLS